MASVNYTSIEVNATSTVATSQVKTAHIVYLINDGAESITFNIDNLVTGDNKFTLKAGEKMVDLPIAIDTLYYKTVTNPAAFRFFGLK